MALPMTRAPTQVTCSLLKTVYSSDGISLISPAQKPAAFPFGYRRIGRPHFKNLTPVPERAAHYTRRPKFPSTLFHQPLCFQVGQMTSEGAL
jgi:hypothetical protein